MVERPLDFQSIGPTEAVSHCLLQSRLPRRTPRSNYLPIDRVYATTVQDYCR